MTSAGGNLILKFLPVSTTIAILYKIFFHGHGKWHKNNSKMSHEKIHVQRKMEKALFEFTRLTPWS